MSRRSQRFSVALLSCFLVVASACGGGGAAPGGDKTSSAPVVKGPVASGLQPLTHGWSFPNFPASSYPDINFDTADIVSMFGTDDTICVDGVGDPCTLTAEAAAWARMVNQARSTGHCEGLVALASSRFNNQESPETVKLPSEEETLHAILRTFATQFIPEVQASIGKWMAASLEDKVNELKTSFASGKLNYTLGVYTAEGGHAVLPYAIEYPTPDTPRIMIYDSNWPAKNRFVDVDLKANTWRFSFAGEDPENDPTAWTGGPAEMDLTPFDARTGTCPFCGEDVRVAKTTLLIRTANLEWSVESGDQVVTPDTGVSADGASAQPVKGLTISSVSPSGGGRSSFDYIVQIPTSMLDGSSATSTSTTSSGSDGGSGGVDLRFSGPSSIFAMTPSGIAEVKTPGNKEQPVTLRNSSIKAQDPAVNITLASGNLVANASGSQVELETNGGTLAVMVTSSNGQVITQEVTPDQPVVQMTADPATGGVTVLAQDSSGSVQQTEVAPNGTETTKTVDPAALNLNSTEVELPKGLESKPLDVLPSLEDRNLANPNYKADEAYVAPTTVPTASESPTTISVSPTSAGGNRATGGPTTTSGSSRNVGASSQQPGTPPAAEPVRPKIGTFSLPTKTYGDDPFTVEAPDSDSTGGFRFTSSRPEVATVSLLTGRVSIVGAGTTTITAAQSAVKGFAAASVSAALTVAKGRPELARIPGITKTFGDDSFTLKAPTSASSGDFTFDSNNDSVARINKTSGRISITGGGRATITVVQAATEDWFSASTEVVVTVRKATPTLELAGSEITKTFGDPDFDLPKPTTPSKGLLRFVSSDSNVLSVTPEGRASVKAAGSATVSVTQAATDDHAGGTTSLAVKIGRTAPTLSEFADVAKTFGDGKFTLPSPKSTGSGRFAFSSDDESVAKVDASTGEVTVVGAGTATLSASQAESTNFAAGRITAKITVAKVAPAVTKFSATGIAFGDEFTLAPESTSKGVLTFTTDKSDIFEVNATTGRVKAVGVGTATLTVRQAATANYEAASRSITVTVAKATPTIGSLTIAPMSYGDIVTPTAPTSTSSGAFTYSSNNTDRVRVLSNGTLEATGVGIVTITATQAEAARYTSGSVSITFSVDKAAPVLTNFVIPAKTMGDAPFQLAAPTSTRTPASFEYALVTSSGPSAPVALTAVATVSSSGQVTILGAGSVQIRAKQPGNSFFTDATIEATLTVAAAPAVLPTSGLVGYWTFDSSTTLGTNNVGTGNLVSQGSTAWSASGRSGGALALNGSSYLAPAASPPTGLPIGNSSYTTAAWFNPSVLNSGGIIGWGSYGSSKQVNALRLRGAGFSHYWWGDDVTPNASLTTGAWFHVAATYDGTTRRIYLDGVQIAEQASSNNNSTASNFAIGATNNFSERFSGLLDEVVVYNRALSVTEVQNLQSRGLRDGLTAAMAGTSAAQLKADFGYTGDGNYWIKPAGYSGAAEEVWCDFDKSGGGWVLIGKGRHSNDSTGGWFGTDNGIATAGLRKENAFAAGGSKLSADFVNKLMNGTSNGWDNTKPTNFMIANRINNATDGYGGIGDSWKIKIASANSFTWIDQFGSSTGAYNAFPAQSGDISRYTSSWLGGDLTGSLASVQIQDIYVWGNNDRRMFNGYWDGHQGHHGWSAGNLVTAGFQAGSERHAIQFVQLWAR